MEGLLEWENNEGERMAMMDGRDGGWVAGTRGVGCVDATRRKEAERGGTGII